MSHKIWQPEHPTPGWIQAEAESDLTIHLPHPDGDVPMFFRRIPAGEFRMGSRGNDPSEELVHLVKIPQDFYLGTFPVTQEQYRAIAPLADVDPEPSEFKDRENSARRPVEQVTWDEATAVCRKLSAAKWFTAALTANGLNPKENWQAGLPSEAIWEYACRAGTETSYWNGDGEAALTEVRYFDYSFGSKTQPMGEKKGTNPWGLHDMHGNVLEWCADVWDEKTKTYRTRVNGRIVAIASNVPREEKDNRSRVVRGGTWVSPAWRCCSSYRSWRWPDARLGICGFRLCVFPDPVKQGSEAKPAAAQPRDEAEQAQAGDGFSFAKAKEDSAYSVELCRNSFSPRSCGDISYELQPTIAMTTTPPTTDRALSSEDGKIWQQSGSVRESRWPTSPEDGETVVKLVLGQLNTESDHEQWKEVLPILASGLKDYFPHLTHLHLWGLPMEELGPLPEGLKVLDVRGSLNLKSVPALPESLEELDVAGCEAISDFPAGGLPKLARFYIDGCRLLPEAELRVFLKHCRLLEEFSAVDCSQINELHFAMQEKHLAEEEKGAHPAFPKRRLKKLVLSGCAGLTKLPDLSSFRWLHHLNLNGCSSLTELPPLPVEDGADGPLGIRYLVTDGCVALRRFCGLDVREVHRSSGPDDNVAPGFRLMHRQATSPSSLVMSKLLVLGSGRCGKTTIAKALQGMAPEKDEKSTRKIQFWPWKTAFQIDGMDTEGLVHIWDFAGQEIYHNTHRLFASQGSVFIIAATHPDTHGKRLERELKEISDDLRRAYHKRENEYRELKYWLDYLRSSLGLEHIDDLKPSRGKVSIVIVHTGDCDETRAKNYLKEQAGPYAHLLDYDLPVMAADFHARQTASMPDGLGSWLSVALGSAADHAGLRVPAVFNSSAVAVQKELETGRAENFIMPFRKWIDFVEKVSTEVPDLDTIIDERRRREQALAVARYLHRCGIVFWLRSPGQDGEVMINQRWGIEKIYALTEHSACEALLPHTGSEFGGGILEDLLDELFSNEKGWSVERRGLVTGLLDQCDVCVRLGNGQWMAVQRELLPDGAGDFQESIAREWDAVATAHPGHVNFSFALHGNQGGMLGDSDFRSLLAFLVRGRGTRVPGILLGEEEHDERFEADWPGGRWSYVSSVRLWKHGLQLALHTSERDIPDALVLRVEWSPYESKSFEGGLFVQLLCADDAACGERFRKLVFGEGGPLVLFDEKVVPSDKRPPDLSKEELPRLRGFGQPGWIRKDGPVHKALRHDIALSYRSNDKAIAEAIVGRFKALGRITEENKPRHLLVYHYAEDELLKLSDDARESKITEIYDYLNTARVLIVIASDSYFETPDLEGKTNLYCPVELAEAICSTHRHSDQFFWVYAGTVSNSNVEEILIGKAPIDKGFIDSYYEAVTVPRLPSDPRNDHRSKLRKRECDAIIGCPASQITKFLEVAGPDTKQSVTAREGSERWLDELQRKVLTALAGETPGEGM